MFPRSLHLLVSMVIRTVKKIPVVTAKPIDPSVADPPPEAPAPPAQETLEAPALAMGAGGGAGAGAGEKARAPLCRCL